MKVFKFYKWELEGIRQALLFYKNEKILTINYGSLLDERKMNIKEMEGLIERVESCLAGTTRCMIKIDFTAIQLKEIVTALRLSYKKRYREYNTCGLDLKRLNKLVDKLRAKLGRIDSRIIYDKAVAEPEKRNLNFKINIFSKYFLKLGSSLLEAVIRR